MSWSETARSLARTREAGLADAAAEALRRGRMASLSR